MDAAVPGVVVGETGANVTVLPPFVPIHSDEDASFPSLFPDTVAERNALKEHVYPKLRDFCRENYGIEFQVTSLPLFGFFPPLISL